MPAVRITIRMATDEEAAARIPADEIPDPVLPDVKPAGEPWAVRMHLPASTVL
jgi:hypothetical protein